MPQVFRISCQTPESMRYWTAAWIALVRAGSFLVRTMPWGRASSISPTVSATATDPDGRIRVVLAHDDPGLHNWMDTQGFERGNLTYRHMLAGQPVPLHTRLVRRADLAAELPAATRTVTPEERVAQTWQRFNGIRLRYGM